jgi:NTE family protein
VNEEKGHSKRVAIACQGGGSHAVFAAGALKRLLTQKQDKHEVVALSGTSGGAMCALLAWYGLLTKGAGEAVRLLDSFWLRDMAANVLPERAMNDWFVGWVGAQESTGLVVEQSPYFFPEIGKDRLEDAIKNNVRFADIGERLVKPESPMLFIGAVNALTGDFRVFKSHRADKEEDREFIFNASREDAISVDAMLASAAVPFLFKAVHTGEAVYWDRADSAEPPARIGKGVYWDGLYSQNPPIRDLTDADPDEIWVLQINPEEIDDEPQMGADIRDRRNELAGNISLNQELYFIRKFNEQIRQTRELIERLKELDTPVEEPPIAKKKIIKVRRIELFMPSLSASSKLDRAPEFLAELMRHGGEQAGHFLKVIPFQLAFEAAWEGALKAVRERKDTEEAVEAVMRFFTDWARIELVPPAGSSAPKVVREGKRQIREWVKRCLQNNFNLEQSRDYRVDGEELSCWVLATADHVDAPAKGRIKATLHEGKIESCLFYPLSLKVLEGLRESMKKAEEQ